MTQHLWNLIAISIMFLPYQTQLKKISFYFYFNYVLFKKIKRRSLDDVTKNSVFIVACLRNHKKYSYLFHDVIMVVKSIIFKFKNIF